jgi:choice-of-anchor C domain-containing protein
MKYLLKLILTTVFSVCLFSSTANAANLIVNPSFELGNWQGNWSWDRVSAGETDITGWTVGGVAVDWHNSAEMTNPHSGLYVVDFNLQGGGSETGTLSQTVNTTANTEYLLSFYLTNPYGYSADTSILNVSIGGNNYSFSKAYSYHGALDWGLNTVSFVASSDLTTITFSSLNSDGYWGPVIDDVSLESIPTPEPSSLLLGFMGLTSILGFKLRLLKS